MVTYDNAVGSAKLGAQRNDTAYFIYHQPKAWEDRDTGWSVIDETDYCNDGGGINERTVCCSVTWGEEKGYFSSGE